MAKRSAAPFSSLWKSPATTAMPFTPSSADKKSVFLFDWWLIEAEAASGIKGKRLAVSGFATRQHATRIFSSAPIVKRNDAYTLEAGDGVTVIVQGMINKARTQDNGFPLEVCNHFLIGFPYNWDHYADEYFKKRSTSSTPRKLFSLDEASNDSTDRAGSTFPIHLDEFPICSVLDFLTSAGDNLTTNFSDYLKNFFMSTSASSKMQKSSSLSMDGVCNHDMKKSAGNIIESAMSVEHHAEVHADSCSKEVECSRNNLNEGTAYGITVSEHKKVDTQKKTSLTNSREMETGSHLGSFISVNHDAVAYVQDSQGGNLDAEDCNHAGDEGSNNFFSSPLLKGPDVSHLNHGKKLGDDAAGQLHSSDKTILCNTNDIPTDLGTKDADSTSEEINDMCNNTLEMINNCNITSIGNPTDRICSTFDVELTRESEVDMCPQKEPVVSVIEQREKKKDSILKQNHDYTGCNGQKYYVHFATSGAKGPPVEEKLGGTTMSPGTEVHLSAVKDHYSSSVTGICTRSGRVLGSSAIVSRSKGSKDKSVSSSKMRVKRVSKNYEIATTSIEKSKNKASCLNFEEKEPTSASENCVFVKYDNRNASTCNSAQDLALISENCTLGSSIEGLSADHLKCSQQLPSVSSCATSKELKKQNGLAIENSSHEDGSPKYLTKGATQSDIPGTAHSSKDKSLVMTGKKVTKKMNNQHLEEPKFSVAEEPNKNKGLRTSRRRKILKQTSCVHQSPLASDKGDKLSVVSPESLNLRRSRSGRWIVPHLDNGCQQIVYDADGSITGIMGVDLLSSPCHGSKSEPAKRKTRL